MDKKLMLSPCSDDHHSFFWLIPCAVDKERLQQVNDALAAEHDTVTFEPHVTVAPPIPVSHIAEPCAALELLLQQQHQRQEQRVSSSMNIGSGGLAIVHPIRSTRSQYFFA